MSLNETKEYLEANVEVDWSKVFYQYTNRLAHLYLLRVLNGIPTCLVNVYFYNDVEQRGPESILEWEKAIEIQKTRLGIQQHKLDRNVIDVFIDVKDIT